MKLNHNLDLIVAALFSLLLIPAVVLNASLVARVTLGVPFLLFIPGYSLVAALFPGRTRLSSVERLAYGLALSIAIVMLDGLLLNYVWKIDVYPLLISLESLTLSIIAVAWLRRRKLAEDERMHFKLTNPWPKAGTLDKLLIGLLLVVIMGAGATAIYTGIKNIQPYSEMYLLGMDGKAVDYPQALKVGQTGQLSLVLTNHERHTVSYTIIISQEDGHTIIDGGEQNEIRFTLANGQKQSYEVTFSFDNTGTGKKLEFNLYKDDSSEIYLTTYLRVDVR